MKTFTYPCDTDVVLANVVSVQPVKTSVTGWFTKNRRYVLPVYCTSGYAPAEFKTKQEAEDFRKDILKAIHQA